MKKIIFFPLLAVLFNVAIAQEQNEEKGGFKKENIFLGGSIGLGIGGWNGGFNIGASPQMGYSITKWLDAGLSFNLNYYSYRAEVNDGVRQRSFNYGGGPFIRIFPIQQIFIQVLPEYNWISTNLKYLNGQTTHVSQRAGSFLAGIGYGRRVVGQSGFFTVLMVDLMQDKDSPYRDSYNAVIPILRGGLYFYLGQKKHNKN